MYRHHPALARLAGRPLALAPRSVERLLSASSMAEPPSAFLPGFGDPAPAGSSGFTLTDSGIAVVPVIGPLVNRGGWLSALLGASSYGDLGASIEAALTDPSSRAVLLEIDSPGGEVGGLFDLIEHIAALREAAHKPIWAVASESALSAAYAIASVADRLYVTRTGEVGSVGVVAVHLDESAADAMAGLKWTLIHAGARKVDGNPHEPLSVQAHADIQADVDTLHAELVGLVARNRGLTPEAVRATEAAVYRGSRGIEVGFADRLGTVDRAIADLTQLLEAPRAPRAISRGRADQPSRRDTAMTTDSNTDAVTIGAATVEPVTPEPQQAAVPEPAQIPAEEQPPQTPAADATLARPSADAVIQQASHRLRTEYAEIAAIAAQAGRLGVTLDVADAMAKGIKPDALRRSVLDALAARADASAVVAVAPQSGAPSGDSPIVRRARERAAAARS